MEFESRNIDFMGHDQTIVIAEVGVNHNCDPGIAREMVDAAIEAGTDIIKFQRFIAAEEISQHAEKAEYQRHTTGDEGSQLEMCQTLELPDVQLREMQEYCRSKQLPFLCTGFESNSVDYLVDVMGLKTLKVPSPEITNLPLLQQIGQKGVGVILSTGASTLAEVALAIETILQAGCPELALLHCVSEYPTPPDQANLRAMYVMREAFDIPVGFSDHTVGIEVAIAAAALGAAIIEKHFTLDRNMPGPDHQASLEPHELSAMIRGIRTANASLGDGKKRPMPCEMANRSLIQKGVVCIAEHLPTGSTLTPEVIGVKRPFLKNGVAPADLSKIIGMQITEELTYDQPLTWNSFHEQR